MSNWRETRQNTEISANYPMFRTAGYGGPWFYSIYMTFQSLN